MISWVFPGFLPSLPVAYISLHSECSLRLCPCSSGDAIFSQEHLNCISQSQTTFRALPFKDKYISNAMCPKSIFKFLDSPLSSTAFFLVAQTRYLGVVILGSFFSVCSCSQSSASPIVNPSTMCYYSLLLSVSTASTLVQVIGLSL